MHLKKKWKLINELFERLDGKSFHEFLEDDKSKIKNDLKPVTYAPHIGYRAWIFTYKGTPICLWDSGNGWWTFHSAVTLMDVIIAKIDIYKEERRQRNDV